MITETDVWGLVKADMEARRVKGIADYGTPVLAGVHLHTLLYWLKHNYDEILDSAVYTKAAILTIESMIREESKS